jgi:TatD DNase family protein
MENTLGHGTKKLQYIDSHAHLTKADLLSDLDPILARAQAAGFHAIINICTDEATLHEGLALARRVPWVFNVAATTPHDVETEGELFFPIVKKAALSGQLVAIGETGLDYFYEHSNRETQKEFLIRYFALAKEVKLPLVFHCRDAFQDLFDLADRHYAAGKAILHCFTGGIEEARGVLERGWLLSISGIATFKKSEALRDVIKMVPLSQMVVETDTPYLAPQKRRGERNEPAFMVETVELIAAIKGVSVAEVAAATATNAIQFFSLPKLER